MADAAEEQSFLADESMLRAAWVLCMRMTPSPSLIRLGSLAQPGGEWKLEGGAAGGLVRLTTPSGKVLEKGGLTK